MSYDPKANIYRFQRLETGEDGKPIAMMKNPKTGLPEPASEKRLVNAIAYERNTEGMLPLDLRFNFAVQILEFENALAALQLFKIEHGIALDTPYRPPAASPSNVTTLPIPSF